MLAYQIRLHLIVIVFGFTGILGKLILIPAELIVLYRMAMASACLGFFVLFTRRDAKSPFRLKAKWFFTGAIVAVHWYTFFESIKLSNVSVALVSLSSTALFTSILEPIFHRKRIQFYELLFSLMIIAGMSIVLSFEFQYALGIAFGITSAFLASLFTVLNSTYVVDNDATEISYYELLGGAFIILAYLLFFQSETLTTLPSLTDMIYLILLAVVATAIAFVVSISVMKKLSPFTVSLTINLEPLYGIILAVIIFGQEELMSGGFYAGFTLILATIIFNAMLKKKERKKASRIIAERPNPGQ